MHRIIKGAIIAATSLVAIGAGSAAHASATIDPVTGMGFVGKGDVQTALGYNNAQMQANATGLKFTSSQDATQAVTQDVTQSATQTATQSAVRYGVELGKQSAEQVMIETLSCEKTNGQMDQRVRYGTREGERTAERIGTAMGTADGNRTGTATGTRSGTQTGDLTGKVSASVAYEARKSNQITGFNLTGFAAGDPKFIADGALPVYGEPTFGGYTFGGYTFGDYSFDDYHFAPYVWSGDFDFGATTWETTDFTSTDPNADPDGVCKEGANNVVPGSVKLVIAEGTTSILGVEVLATLHGNIVPGDIVPGGITEGGIESGATMPGAVTANGAAAVFVNGTALNAPVA